ncbi:MAG: cysteine-rich CWC family protein [Candidatus Acidiferrales bacterium]
MSQHGSEARSVAREPAQKTCVACAGVFSCFAAQGGCWCEEVKLSSKTLSELRARYADCLCPSCLDAASVVEH